MTFLFRKFTLEHLRNQKIFFKKKEKKTEWKSAEDILNPERPWFQFYFCPLLTVALSKFLKTSLSLVFFIYNIGMKSPTLQLGETVKIKWGVFICLGWHHKIPDWVFKQHKSIFSRHQYQGASRVGSGLQMATFRLCPHTAERKQGQISLLRRALISP